MAFKNVEGNNKLQSDSTYKQCMEEFHKNMILLQAYKIQTRYMWRCLYKPSDMNVHQFVAQINKINDCITQFPPKDNSSPQEKLPNDEIMDILEAAMHKKGQSKFVMFCKNLETVDPGKMCTSSSNSKASNGCIPKRKKKKQT
eukprot:14807331-Ditylum_brightwellii.AAC.1